MTQERIADTYADDFTNFVTRSVYEGNKTEDELAVFIDPSVETHTIETNASRLATIKLFLFDDGSFAMCQPGLCTPIVGTIGENKDIQV